MHYIVFKQCASHLPHEANVEQIFSLAGKLADPNLGSDKLSMLTRVHFNKKAFTPTVSDIRVRYLVKYGKAALEADQELLEEYNGNES